MIMIRIFKNEIGDEVVKKLDKIEVEVTDNFDDNVTINVYLDKELYNGSEISEGKHNLFVEAIDQAGNLKSINYDFAVSSSGVIENIFNGNIKIKTSVYIYVIIGLSVIFVVINVLINYKFLKLRFLSEKQLMCPYFFSLE